MKMIMWRKGRYEDINFNKIIDIIEIWFGVYVKIKLVGE
jgi:hypothetical protein